MGVVGRGTVLAGRYQLRDARPTDTAEASDWAAVDQILARPVAVRVFPASGSAAALDAARRAALVFDPRLVRVLDVGTHDDVAYVVSEQVTGRTLAELVAREPLSADQARAVVGEAAAALETARRRGVHHLALRPSAVAVGDDGRVLVVGLALDSALRGLTAGDARTTSRADATDLVRLAYTALTGRWPGPVATSDGLPTAPETDGVPVPPAELVPGVPPDLNTLCQVTLGRADDGPHSPAEVVRELEPWGEIRIRPGSVGPAPAAAVAPAAVAPGAPPNRVVRQSVRSAFGGPTAAAARPGTPPPAAPQPPQPVAPAAAFPPAAEATTTTTRPLPPPGPTSAGPEPAPRATPTAAAPPTASVPPAAAAPPSAAVPPTAAVPPISAVRPTAADDPFDFGLVEEEQPRRVGVAVAIALVGLAVLVGLGFAVRALVSGVGLGAEGGPSSATTTTSSPTTTTAPTDAATTTSAPPTTTAPAGVPPTITGITSIDPSDTDGEHQEAVGRAIDGDPGTYWFSQTYTRDDFSGIKDGVGLALTFAQPATVGTVTLHVNGTGGNVEIRASDAAGPSGGAVLASGPMSPDTVLTLSAPTTTDSLVVWFTQLPTNGEGKFRIELTEIELG